MRRFLAFGSALLLAITIAHAEGGRNRGQVLAHRVFTVADDFVVEVYKNGLRVPDDKRTLLDEQFGATAERIDIEVREGDWLVFNVVNNRLRWGGCSYFGVTGRSDTGISFVTEPESGRWSCCDDLRKVQRFVTDRDYLTENHAQKITNPWGDGDHLMNRVADGWSGKPIWGKSRNTWIKFVAR